MLDNLFSCCVGGGLNGQAADDEDDALLPDMLDLLRADEGNLMDINALHGALEESAALNAVNTCVCTGCAPACWGQRLHITGPQCVYNALRPHAGIPAPGRAAAFPQLCSRAHRSGHACAVQSRSGKTLHGRWAVGLWGRDSEGRWSRGSRTDVY